MRETNIALQQQQATEAALRTEARQIFSDFVQPVLPQIVSKAPRRASGVPADRKSFSTAELAQTLKQAGVTTQWLADYATLLKADTRCQFARGDPASKARPGKNESSAYANLLASIFKKDPAAFGWPADVELV